MGIQKIYYALTVLFIFLFSFAPTASGQELGDTQNGLATWYGAKYHGRKTSSGEKFNRHKYTAAHNGLPLGSKVKVTNVSTGESVIVKINDRGPFGGARIIDLSEAAARKIHTKQSGLAKVTVEVIDLPDAFLAARAAKEKKESKLEEAATKVEEALALAPVTPAPAPTVVTTASAEPAVTPTAPVLQQPYLFAVQAGAFGTLANAETQVEKLRKLYHKMPIALVEETVNGRKVHRILAGKFVSKAAAEQARQDLVKKGFQGLVRQLPDTPVLASTAPF